MDEIPLYTRGIRETTNKEKRMFYEYLLLEDLHEAEARGINTSDVTCDTETTVAMMVSTTPKDYLSSKGKGQNQAGQAGSNGQDWREAAICFCEMAASNGLFFLWDGAEEAWTLHIKTEKGWIETEGYWRNE